MSPRTPLVAAGLSAVMPGLGQLYNREYAKGAANLLSATGIWFGLLWTTVGPDASRSLVSAVVLLLAYPFLLLPAVLDAHRRASGIPEDSSSTSSASSTSSRASRWQVIVLLLVIGPLAIPQLWQCSGFSRGAKVSWTVLVGLVSVIAILAMVALGPALEQWIEGSYAADLFR